MRTSRAVLLAMFALVAVAATGWAQNNASKANIIGSAHDFTASKYSFLAPGGTTNASAATNTCFFCHIIHKTATSSSGLIGGTAGAVAAPGYLLWNHQLSSQASYGVYSSDTFTVALAAGGTSVTDLGTYNSSANWGSLTTSNLCLSCHDGTVAIASFYEGGVGLPANGSSWSNGHGNSSTMWTGMTISNLSQSHPVNFIYNGAMASAVGLKSPANGNSVDGAGAVPLYGGTGYMQCTTCHDPHNGTFLGATNGTSTTSTVFPFPRLFLYNYSGSGGFCTYCHT